MLDIVYRDDWLVAINKPAGLLVHRSNLDRSETRFAVQLLRDQIGQRVYPVHRLDRGTSGVLLFALNADTARRTGVQFERGDVTKLYLAVVRGWPDESGQIDHPLTRQFDDYGRPVTPNSSMVALPAATSFRRLATVELSEAVDRYPSARYALVELTPHTGRQHQLRRHMKHIAHPIIGDATWGKGKHNRFFQQRFGAGRMLLASVRLDLTHPHTNRLLCIYAPLDGAFAGLLQQLNWPPYGESIARVSGNG